MQRWIYQAQGNYDAALAAYQREQSFSNATSEWPAILAQVQAVGQRQVEAQATLQRALAPQELRRTGDYITYEIALGYVLLGTRDQAFVWLEKADAARTNGFNFIAVEPLLDGLRGEARFAALLRKAGFR